MVLMSWTICSRLVLVADWAVWAVFVSWVLLMMEMITPMATTAMMRRRKSSMLCPYVLWVCEKGAPTARQPGAPRVV